MRSALKTFLVFSGTKKKKNVTHKNKHFTMNQNYTYI